MIDIAGLMWHPETPPMEYTIASTDRPKANDMPTESMPTKLRESLPASTALPQPMNTSTNVPMSSATYFFATIASLILRTYALMFNRVWFIIYFADDLNEFR